MPHSQVSFASEHDDYERDEDATPRTSLPQLRTSGLNDSGNLDHEYFLMPTPNERTRLLGSRRTSQRYADEGSPPSKSRELSRVNSRSESLRRSRTGSRFNTSPVLTRRLGLRTPKTPKTNTLITGQALKDELVWYDQFTSTDWVRDSIADGYRVLELRKVRGFRGRARVVFDAAQGWILVAIIGGLTATFAYLVDIMESPLYDWKQGYCSTYWQYSKGMCCQANHDCQEWKTWADIFHVSESRVDLVNYLGFIISCMVLAALSCGLTLFTKTVVPSNIAVTFDENLGADDHHRNRHDAKGNESMSPRRERTIPPPMTYYSAAGSGVAEVKVILSGFVLHGYLGVKTLIIKFAALILSVASGMSLGKEGPYVHIATCLGNIACRLFSKYNLNDAKRREMLSAAAASGVAVAFGSPLGGVLFSLEEVSYYFPPKTLFRTFTCCIVAALSLKFFNPYGTNKIVLFEVRYTTDWRFFELICFSLIGVAGGLLGALFIKASKLWATTFRRIPIIKKRPMLEVLLVALVTGLLSYWNRYSNVAVIESLLELASPCTAESTTGLCPDSVDDIPAIIKYLLMGFLIKAFLTVITFGIKVPAVILFELTGSLDHVLPFSLGILFAKWTADFVEPRSIYDLLIDMNSYPFMDNRVVPVFDAELGDITPPVRLSRIIDISLSRFIKASELRSKLTNLQNAGELDGGLPIIRDKVLVGMIPVPDLEFALDKLEGPDEDTMCLMSRATHAPFGRQSLWASLHLDSDSDSDSHSEDADDQGESADDDTPRFLHRADLTPYIDPAPVALDVRSPMDLAYQCFVKLGLRYVCTVEGGEYRGMVHKKIFVKYVKDNHLELDGH